MGVSIRFIRFFLVTALILGGTQSVWAQKVLMLTTNVTAPNAENPDAILAYDHLQSEFESVVGASNLTRRACQKFCV